MKICVIAVGNVKDRFYKEAVSEYAKRISRFCDFEMMETKEEKIPDHAGESIIAQIKKAEMENINKKLALLDSQKAVRKYIAVALDIKGKSLDSVAFAKKLEDYMSLGNPNICFIIGGSLGLHDDILKKADLRLSLSVMTFPHVLARVILAEQIYRAFKIINGQKYHK